MSFFTTQPKHPHSRSISHSCCAVSSPGCINRIRARLTLTETSFSPSRISDRLMPCAVMSAHELPAEVALACPPLFAATGLTALFFRQGQKLRERTDNLSSRNQRAGRPAPSLRCRRRSHLFLRRPLHRRRRPLHSRHDRSEVRLVCYQWVACSRAEATCNAITVFDLEL